MAKLSADTDDQIDEALAAARNRCPYELAVAAVYAEASDVPIVTLKTGRRLAIPRENLQDLAEVSSDLVKEVEIDMGGRSLHWEKLNIDFRVDSLRRGCYGGESWMERLAARDCGAAA